MPTESVYCGSVTAAKCPADESVRGRAEYGLVLSDTRRNQSQFRPQAALLFRAASGLPRSAGCRMLGPRWWHLVGYHDLVPPGMGAELGCGEGFEGKLHFLGVAR